MITDDSGYAFIRAFEGLKLKPYLDQEGNATIGIGCVKYNDGTPVKITDPAITMDKAISMFHYQVGLKSAAVNGLHIQFNQNQFNAIVDFAYNLGIIALAKSTLAKKARINTNDPTIRDEFMRWNKCSYIKGGVKIYIPSQGLTHRRSLEADLYFTPV